LLLFRQLFSEQHLVGHIKPVRFSCRADAASGKQHINAATWAEIEHDFTGLQFSKGRGVAAAQGSFESRISHFAVLRRIVEVWGCRITGPFQSGRVVAAAGNEAFGTGLSSAPPRAGEIEQEEKPRTWRSAWHVADNRITRLAINIGLTDSGRTEVTRGLSKETPVVTTFRAAPPPGTAVRENS
jgi:hypothetical protein